MNNMEGTSTHGRSTDGAAISSESALPPPPPYDSIYGPSQEEKPPPYLSEEHLNPRLHGPIHPQPQELGDDVENHYPASDPQPLPNYPPQNVTIHQAHNMPFMGGYPPFSATNIYGYKYPVQQNIHQARIRYPVAQREMDRSSSGSTDTNTYLLVSILTCMCCSPLFGCIGICFALAAQQAAAQGDTERARARGHSALVCCMIGVIISMISFFFYWGTHS